MTSFSYFYDSLWHTDTCSGDYCCAYRLRCVSMACWNLDYEFSPSSISGIFVRCGSGGYMALCWSVDYYTYHTFFVSVSQKNISLLSYYCLVTLDRILWSVLCSLSFYSPERRSGVNGLMGWSRQNCHRYSPRTLECIRIFS